MSEYTNEVVVEAYRKYLRRAPDAKGFTYYVEQVNDMLSKGRSPSQVEEYLKKDFTGSVEYKAYTSKK